MNSTGVYRCGNDGRRTAVLNQSVLNGIDYLEVVDHEAAVDADRQRFLRVTFVKTPAPANIAPANVVIRGGERIRTISVTHTQMDGDVLVVEVNQRGDFSTYTLSLIDVSTGATLAGIDAALASIDFSFKVECPSDFDCQVDDVCPAVSEEPPHIDYLAKDYASFRRLMLDRLSLLLPGWAERSAADLAVTLVELLAYTGDHLSYQQDAIATEAYLGTARRRTSVRRHARLVDYLLHDGANARCFIQVKLLPSVTLSLAAGTQFFSHLDGIHPQIAAGGDEYFEALGRGPVVFETLAMTNLDSALNILQFYTWRSENCCLPRGATSATLKDHPPLSKGDFLIFGEVKGPQTGNVNDADPTRRHVVRLTDVTHTSDALAPAVDITEIVWAAEDALPFPLCISSTIEVAGQPQPVEDVSLAAGNIVLAEHGRSVSETLKPVGDPARFRPRLTSGPLTQRGPVDFSSASAALHPPMAEVLPDVNLTATPAGTNPDWIVRRDLLGSDATSQEFVAETEDDGIATLRFGDDEYGQRPESGTVFTANYKAGNGTAGNVGASALTHIVSGQSGIDFVWNPLPAEGGIDPEPIEHARQVAPAAFRVQERAVTEADYAEVTERRTDVDRAAATFRWTGSWHTLFDSVDRRGGLDADDPFRADVRHYLERYRVIGHDIEVNQPLFVSLEIALTVCVLPGYFRSDIEVTLRDLFSAGIRRDGTRGFFNPDNFTFGQPVVMSRIIAAAASIDGVDAVNVDRFRRQGAPATDAIATGVLALNRLEIARLENSRDFPEHGRLTLTMRGGV